MLYPDITFFKQLNLFQKAFFILIIAGLLFYGLLHMGLIKLPAARARDCTKYPNSKTIEVKIENGKFVPDRIEVQVCDSLKFINLTDTPAEPAVGPHPEHTSYPGFESSSALLKNDIFIFQLNRPGTYGFHDHLHEEIEGNLKISK